MNSVSALSGIRLRLLGYPRVERAGATVVIPLRKGLALLALLARARRPLGRDSVVALLWPEDEEGSGRTKLRRLLHRMRGPLGALIVAQADTLALDPDVSCDLNDIERAAAARDGALLGRRLEEGVATFLEGFGSLDSEAFEEWRTQEAASAHESIAGAFRVALDVAPGALSLARAWVAHDPYEPHAHTALVRALRAAGRDIEAKQAHTRAIAVLGQDLPSPATTTVTVAASGAPPATRYVLSQGVHIGYQVVGASGPPLLFMPGFVSHLDLGWHAPSVARFLTAMGEGRRLILFDRCGVGVSDRIGLAPTVDRTADDIAAVLHATSVERAFVFAASEAGPAALRFAARHPDRVVGLMLYGTLACGTRRPDFPWAMSRTQHRRWLEAMRDGWGGPVALDVFAPSLAQHADVQRWWATLLRAAASPGTLSAIVEAFRDADARDDAERVRSPSIVLHRRGDRAVRVEAGQDLARRLGTGRFVDLAGSDHWPWAGDAAAIQAEVDRFMAACR